MNVVSTNQILFDRIKKLVAEDHRIGIEILECLYEIERRKAYSDLHYDGLYTYCIKELGFSDAQAYQRIQAMYAMKEIPEIKPMIASGSLSVSSVSKVHTHLRQETKKGVKPSKIEKLTLFSSMQNHSTREVDLKLSAIRGEIVKEKLVLELNTEMQSLWRQIKEHSAHKTRNDDLLTLQMLMQTWWEKHDPLKVRKAA